MFPSYRNNLFDLDDESIEWGSKKDGKAGCKCLNETTVY